MPSPSLLQIAGAKGQKETRYAPIFTDRFFVGYWSNRNPLRSPLSTFYADGWHLGGTDAIIAGTNVELSPRLTLCRRPGNTAYSSSTIPTPPLTFYPFRLFGATSPAIDVIVDTATNIYTLDPANATSIFTKAANAGQSNFLGIGQTLYFGDGAEVMAWQNGSIRNWGISISPFTAAVGPNTAGTGASSAWSNPSDVTGSGGYASVNLTQSAPAPPSESGALFATNFGFSLGLTEIIGGITITLTGYRTIVSGTPKSTGFIAQLLRNGSPVGNQILLTAPTSSGTVTFGGSANLWGISNYSANDINQSTWGVQINAYVGTLNLAYNVNFFVQNVQATVNGIVAPAVSTTGSGTFVAYTGYSYAAAYGNSSSGQVSSATPVSVTTGPFGAGISTSTQAGAGSGYAVNDTGIVIAGASNAKYIVTSVSAGAVTGYTITAAGTGYTVSNNVGTATGGAQPGVGTGFSINITALTGFAGLHVGLIASTDPQVNQIWLFRTTDGGNTWLNLPTSPYPNTTQTITDSNVDTTLNILEQAPLNFVNNPPPTAALDPVYYLDLVWVHVGNAVYFSRTPSAIVGVTQESFPPANAFTFPETVIRKVAFTSGLLVFTTSNIYIILGNNTTSSVLYSAPFLSGYGIQSWNALWIDGTNVYFFTSDNRLIELNPSSGVSDVGFAIADQLATLNPASVYVTQLSRTSNDSAVYIGDGSTGWYRLNPNQAPDQVVTGGIVWSPKATIVGGLQALVGIETSPGVKQLMMGGTGNNQPVLVRDSTYTTFTDNGTAYPSNLTIGSVVLAQPGQMAVCRFITADFIQTGTSPIVSVLLGEISGSFENISGYTRPDPPYLTAASTIYNNRYYFKQTVGGANPKPVVCRHLQIKIDYGSTDTVQNELLSLTINGAIRNEK